VEYFSELTWEQAQKLYELYKEDFEMFHYKPDKYLEMTSTEMPPLDTTSTTVKAGVY